MNTKHHLFAFVKEDGSGCMVHAENIEHARFLVVELAEFLNQQKAEYMAGQIGTDAQFDSMIGGEL